MHLWTRASIPNNVIYCSRPTSGTLFSIRIWHVMFDTNMVPCLSYMEAQTSDHSGEKENLKHLGSLSHPKTKEIYSVLKPWEVKQFYFKRKFQLSTRSKARIRSHKLTRFMSYFMTSKHTRKKKKKNQSMLLFLNNDSNKPLQRLSHKKDRQ